MIIDFHKLFVLVGDFELIEAGEPDFEALSVLFEADLLFDILYLSFIHAWADILESHFRHAEVETFLD